MRKLLAISFVLMVALAAPVVHAVQPDEVMSDPARESRARDLSRELRCLVCQNQSLAGSRADLAQDLRREVRKLITEGKTDAEVKDFMVSRYGDFVLYRPPVKPTTWLLWGGPFLLLLIAVAALIMYLRRRSRTVARAVPQT